MDFRKLRLFVEEYPVLTGFSSLPFIVDIQNSTAICWFNYFLDQSMDCLNIKINDVFTVSDNDVVSSHKLSTSVKVQLEEYDEPQKQDGEYFGELEKLYSRYSPEQMMNLLKSAEISPLLPAYKKVAEFLKESGE